MTDYRVARLLAKLEVPLLLAVPAVMLKNSSGCTGTSVVPAVAAYVNVANVDSKTAMAMAPCSHRGMRVRGLLLRHGATDDRGDDAAKVMQDLRKWACEAY